MHCSRLYELHFVVFWPLASLLFSWGASRGASLSIVEVYLLFSTFSRKWTLFACKTSHLEAWQGEYVDCNLPFTHSNVITHFDCILWSSASECITFFTHTSPQSRETQIVDTRRARLVCLIHIGFSLLHRTHTPALQWNMSVPHAFGWIQSLVPGNGLLLWVGVQPALPMSVAKPVPRAAVHFPPRCLSAESYFHGIQPTCKWAEAERRTDQTRSIKSPASRLHAPI